MVALYSFLHQRMKDVPHSGAILQLVKTVLPSLLFYVKILHCYNLNMQTSLCNAGNPTIVSLINA